VIHHSEIRGEATVAATGQMAQSNWDDD